MNKQTNALVRSIYTLSRTLAASAVAMIPNVAHSAPTSGFTPAPAPKNAGIAPDGKTWNDIAFNITDSISTLPGLLAALSYLLALVFGAQAIVKIMDHVERPAQTPFKDGLIRLLAGGTLLALPILYEAMFSTIGTGAASTSAAQLRAVTFSVN